MMEKGQNIPNGKRAVGLPKRETSRICKVCGKEGLRSHIRTHIEANHLEVIPVPCEYCGKTHSSRTSLNSTWSADASASLKQQISDHKSLNILVTHFCDECLILNATHKEYTLLQLIKPRAPFIFCICDWRLIGSDGGLDGPV